MPPSGKALMRRELIGVEMGCGDLVQGLLPASL
jgi:hypothetical protein